jgi:hypothetical protein
MSNLMYFLLLNVKLTMIHQTLARILRKAFSNSVIIHQDDFYKVSSSSFLVSPAYHGLHL